MATKTISIEQLQIGMYVAKLDVAWWRSPFLRHSFLVKTQAQIDKLWQTGITEVVIDLSKGDDVSSAQSAPPKSPAVVTAAVPTPVTKGPKPLAQLNEEYAQAKKVRADLEQAVHGLFTSLSKQGTVSRRHAAEAAQEIAIVTRTLPTSAVFMALSSQRAADPSLSQHALSTCTLTMVLGQSLGYNPIELQELALAALLHDLGLLQIPAAIVRQSANTSVPLPARERRVFESHPQLTILTLERQGGFDPTMLQLIGEHHVRLDGSGYPHGILGEFTSERSRVLMVADHYDELLSGFGGASPLAPYQALQRLFQEGQDGLLDQSLISRLVKLVGIYPVHSHVRLNTKETAIVVQLNATALHQPVVAITHAPNGTPIPQAQMLDLSHQDPAEPERTIEAVLPLREPTVSINSARAA